MDKSKTYINPYLGGVLLGLVLLLSIYLTGRGLGASGAIKSVVVSAVETVAPKHAENSTFYSKYTEAEESPLKSWLAFEVLGVFFGGLLSGAIRGRLKLKTEHSPKINAKSRWIMALLGGLFFGLGSQLGRGCTSGAALSGMAVLSTAGFVSMLAIFGSGYVFAYFFRKFWI